LSLMRIFCPATLLLPSFLLGPVSGHGGRALSPEGVALAVAAALYLSWCSGPRGRVCRP